MPSINGWRRDGEWITRVVETDTQTAEITDTDYRRLSVALTDFQLLNDGKDSITATISVVDGLELARGTEPANATVLDHDGDVTISVDGQQTTKTLTNGSVSFDLTTDKPAGSEIEIVAGPLADHPAESDSATIEVVSE